MGAFLRLDVKTKNELVFFIKHGHWLSAGGILLVLQDQRIQRIVKGEVLTDFSPGDLARAHRIGPENEAVVEKLIKLLVLFGATGKTDILTLHNRQGADVLARLSLVE